MSRNKQEPVDDIIESQKWREYEKEQHDAWIRRGKRTAFPTDEWILRTVSELRELYNETNPRFKKLEKGKLWNARHAIAKAYQLYSSLSCWAEDHIEGATFNFYQNGKKPIDINSHKNEQFFLDKKNIEKWSPTPEAIREVYANIIEARCPTSLNDPRGWKRLSDALISYNEGEIQVVLERTKSGKRGAKGNKPTLDILKMIALYHVYILRGFNHTQEAARDCVAEELGITKDALIKWEKNYLKIQPDYKKNLIKHISEINNFLVVKKVRNLAKMTALERVRYWQKHFLLIEPINLETESYLRVATRVLEKFPLYELRQKIVLASMPSGKVSILWEHDPLNGVHITLE